MINTTIIINDTSHRFNEIYWISLVTIVNINISRYANGFVLLLGNIGSILSCLTLSQPSLRKNRCAMYFLAASIIQFFSYNFALITRMLHFGYNIQTVNRVLWFCKFRFYFSIVLATVARYHIILAYIDRYFTSSLNENHRRWISKTIALRLIIINTILWPLMSVHILIFYKIENGQCSPGNNIYNVFFSIYIAIDTGILPLSLTLVFGLLTFKNLRQIKQSINSKKAFQSSRKTRLSKKEIQFCRIIINDALLFITFNIMNPCYLLYQAFTLSVKKSPLRQLIELTFHNTTYVFILLGSSLTFSVYILSSSLFRQEFIKLIRTKFIRQSR